MQTVQRPSDTSRRESEIEKLLAEIQGTPLDDPYFEDVRKELGRKYVALRHEDIRYKTIGDKGMPRIGHVRTFVSGSGHSGMIIYTKKLELTEDRNQFCITEVSYDIEKLAEGQDE